MFEFEGKKFYLNGSGNFKFFSSRHIKDRGGIICDDFESHDFDYFICLSSDKNSIEKVVTFNREGAKIKILTYQFFAYLAGLPFNLKKIEVLKDFLLSATIDDESPMLRELIFENVEYALRIVTEADSISGMEKIFARVIPLIKWLVKKEKVSPDFLNVFLNDCLDSAIEKNSNGLTVYLTNYINKNINPDDRFSSLELDADFDFSDEESDEEHFYLDAYGIDWLINRRIIFKSGFNDLKPGDTFTIGRYLIGKKGETGPLLWRVIAKESKGAYDYCLALCFNIIEIMPFDSENGGSKWQTCTLRRWLNNTFYNFAFNENEKRLIDCFRYKTSIAVDPFGCKRSNSDETEFTDDFVTIPDPAIEEYAVRHTNNNKKISDFLKCADFTPYLKQQRRPGMFKDFWIRDIRSSFDCYQSFRKLEKGTESIKNRRDEWIGMEDLCGVRPLICLKTKK